MTRDAGVTTASWGAGRGKLVVYSRKVAVLLGVVSVFTLSLCFAATGGAKPRIQDEKSADGSSAGRSIIPGHYIVVLRDAVEEPGRVGGIHARLHGGEVGFVYRAALNGYSIEGLTKGEAQALRKDPRVRYIEPDRKEKEAFVQSTPTGVSRVFAPQNPLLDIDGVDDIRIDVDIAVIDSGIDYTHPDLNVYARTDCSSGTCVNGAGTDGYSHGTHVAGTIAAVDNDFGVVGVAPGARLWAVKVLDDEGYGSLSRRLAGINWVTERASQIEAANMSIGTFSQAVAQNEAIAKSVAAGVVYVAAASNEGYNAATITPANHPDVITVSAVADYDGQPGGKASGGCNEASDDHLLSYSDWGATVEIAAPGACIESTLPGGKYGRKSGTSMATPHVTGAAAILASQSNPNSKQDVENIRRTLINGGSFAWTDTSQDGEVESLLYLDDQALSKTEVATAGWSSTDGAIATVFGSFNPRGLASTYLFEYGPTSAYGQSAPVVPKSSTGVGFSTVSQDIAGLRPGQTYHYRLKVVNSSGTFYGADRTLTVPQWATQQIAGGPAAPEEEWLEDVSCPVASECFAVGLYYENGQYLTGMYRRSGSAWSFKQLPTPAGGSRPRAEAISCVTATACVAVGYVRVEEKFVPLVERWNGTSWTAQAIAPPYSGAPDSALEDISCTSATTCMAVGTYKNASGKYVSYALQWKNGVWATVLPPHPEGASQSVLEGVSCSSSNSCVAVGWFNAAGTRPLIVAWNGSNWVQRSAARSFGWLTGVSCVSETSCTAVGGSLGDKPAAEAWNGGSWSSQAMAASEDGADMKDVHCESPSYCRAVGHAWIGWRPEPVTQLWDGASWQVDPAPRRAEKAGELLGISCNGLSGCTSVGGSIEVEWNAEALYRENVVTGAVSSLRPASAVLTGVVNPAGAATTFQFEYGPTVSYGSKVPLPETSVGSGGNAVEISQEVTGLNQETTYHYRVVATNAHGTAYGKDRTFRTPALGHQFVGSIGSTGSANGQLNDPWGLDVDVEGNVWVADRLNHRVQKFNSKGEFVSQFGSFGTANGQFNEPLDVAVDGAGSLWVTDGGNSRVQKFTPNGEFLQKFGASGTGNGQFTEPWGIDVSPDGTIWVVDARYYRIQQFYPSGGFIRQVTGFEGPRGLAVGPDGHVWVTENTTGKIHKLATDGTRLSSFGTKGSGVGQLDEPQAIDVKPSGQVLVADRQNDDVQQFTPDGQYVGEFGAGQLLEPRGLAVAPHGTVYVSNTYRDRVEKWQQPLPPTYSSSIGTWGTGNGQFVAPADVEVDGSTGDIWVADRANHRIQRFNSKGEYLSQFGSVGTANGQFKSPVAVTLDQKGNLWVADSGNARLQKFNSKGELLLKCGSQGTGNGQFSVWGPKGIAVDSGNNIWVTDYSGRVQKFNESCVFLKSIGSSGTGNGQFIESSGIDVGAGKIWVGDWANDRVSVFSEAGEYLSQFGSEGTGDGQFKGVDGVEVDSKGNVWVLDGGNDRVQQFNQAGEYLARFGSSGSGAGQFNFSPPANLTSDGKGALLIADSVNHRVQKWLVP